MNQPIPKLGRHLSNIHDPSDPRARDYQMISFEDFKNGQEAIEQSWKNYQNWINKNVIGPPKATETYTVEQLEEMKMVGLYEPIYHKYG